MFQFFKRIFLGDKCYFCNKPTQDKRYYLDKEGNKIAVCGLCAEYAERRAYRKHKQDS